MDLNLVNVIFPDLVLSYNDNIYNLTLSWKCGFNKILCLLTTSPNLNIIAWSASSSSYVNASLGSRNVGITWTGGFINGSLSKPYYLINFNMLQI